MAGEMPGLEMAACIGRWVVMTWYAGKDVGKDSNNL